MFRVGDGAIPAIPETLSDEGQDFLGHCFEHDPRERPTASELMDHAFVKVLIIATALILLCKCLVCTEITIVTLAPLGLFIRCLQWIKLYKG